MKTEIWKPHPGPQSIALARNEDVLFYGGTKGPGKTEALLMAASRDCDNSSMRSLILRRTFPMLQEIVDRSHKRFSLMGAHWQGDTHRWVFPSGAIVEFGHCQSEQDKERYQGREFSFIGFDQLEQFTESQFNFICAQNRTSDASIKCQIWATANPGGPGHWWVKRRFIDRRDSCKTYTDEYEMRDGRKVTRTLCCVRGTIYDNPTLMEANPTYLANLLSLPEAERKALLEGDWDVYVSQCIFDKRGMQTQENHIEEPKWTGYLRVKGEFIELHEDVEDGRLQVWIEPREGHQYQIGSDALGGVEEGDPACAHVVDKQSWEVVAKWSGNVEPSKFAEVLELLSLYYYGAEIAQEADKYGLVVIERLKDRQAKLYQCQPDKYGFETNQTSRHMMLCTLKDAITDHFTKVRSRETLDEMYNFIRNPETAKWEARAGCHDDAVISLGIALQTTRVNPFEEEDSGRSVRISSFLPSRKKRERVAA